MITDHSVQLASRLLLGLVQALLPAQHFLFFCGGGEWEGRQFSKEQSQEDQKSGLTVVFGMRLF